MKIVDLLNRDFLAEIVNEFGKEEAKKVVSKELDHLLNHSLNLRPGDSFIFYSLPLYVMCRLLRPKVVLETGVQNGGSTQTILCALRENNVGRLFSVDSGEVSTDGTHTNTWGPPGKNVSEELKSSWDLRIGYTSNIFPTLLPEIENVDLFFHDSDHSKQNVEYEFEAVKKFSSKNSWLGLHDHYGQWDSENIMSKDKFVFIIGKDRPPVHQKDGKYHNVLRLWKQIS